ASRNPRGRASCTPKDSRNSCAAASSVDANPAQEPALPRADFPTTRTNAMNAVPNSLLQQTEQLSGSVTRPIPGSRKIHVEGSRPDIRVAMREIELSPTPTLFGGEDNPPVTVYDPSGPYTDPDATIDLATGLAPLRAGWIEERGDTEALPRLSSEFGRGREGDARLDAVRFPNRRLPRVAKAGANVSQMHYARRGIVTPEMEYVAIRENQRLELVRDATLRSQRSEEHTSELQSRENLVCR